MVTSQETAKEIAEKWINTLHYCNDKVDDENHKEYILELENDIKRLMEKNYSLPPNPEIIKSDCELHGFDIGVDENGNENCGYCGNPI